MYTQVCAEVYVLNIYIYKHVCGEKKYIYIFANRQLCTCIQYCIRTVLRVARWNTV